MKDVQVLDELHVITLCQKVISDLLNLAHEECVVAGQLGVLLTYLHDRQEKLLKKLSQ